MITGRRSAAETLPAVDSDNFEGARSAVAHLVAGGRRAIATITGRLDVYGAQCRLDGYRAALAAAGLPPDARHLDPALTSVRRPIEEMGRTMAEVLLQEITGGTGERPRIVLPTELVVRESS